MHGVSVLLLMQPFSNSIFHVNDMEILKSYHPFYVETQNGFRNSMFLQEKGEVNMQKYLLIEFQLHICFLVTFTVCLATLIPQAYIKVIMVFLFIDFSIVVI